MTENSQETLLLRQQVNRIMQTAAVGTSFLGLCQGGEVLSISLWCSPESTLSLQVSY
jgi:hypothetical protein